MNYYFVKDNKSNRHIVIAKNVEDLDTVLKKANIISKCSYMLTENTFEISGFLISDK